MISAAGATAVSSLVCSRRGPGANDTIRVAVIGFNSKGAQHIEVFHNLEGVQVVALCDVDKDILAREAQKFSDRQEKVDTYTDARYVLDDKNIDVVAIATPNHWHSLLAIWACQAGKDIYVEKPISHNIFEGRKLIEATRKYHRIVQSGTQNRSDVGLLAAEKYIREGNLGAVEWAHGLWYKFRPSIGKVNGPQEIPPQIDYDLWTGPARLEPLMRINLHYDWHWKWDTGNGDMGNLGVHQIDDCRWLAGHKTWPKRVLSVGGRFGYVDDGETPNTNLAIFDYESAPIFIEIRTLPAKTGVRSMDHLHGVRAGNIIKCEQGYFAGGRGGGWVYDLDWKKIKQFPGDGGGDHQANFIAAVRSRQESDLRANVSEGHLSSGLCHIANISYRLGSRKNVEEVAGSVEKYEEAMETVKRLQSHLAANEVDLQAKPLVLGPWLEFDAENEKFTGDMNYEANMFLSRNYRAPFVVSEKV